MADKAIRYLFAIITPIIVAGMFASDWIFPLWLGEDIGAPAAEVAKLCLIGSWAVAFAKIGHTKLQAGGAPQKVVYSVVVQMVIFLPLMVWLTLEYGVIGAAGAFAIRQSFDAVLLYRLAFGNFAYGLRFAGMLAFLIACWILTFWTSEFGLLAQLAIFTSMLVPVLAASWIAAPELFQKPLAILRNRGSHAG